MFRSFAPIRLLNSRFPFMLPNQPALQLVRVECVRQTRDELPLVICHLADMFVLVGIKLAACSTTLSRFLHAVGCSDLRALCQ